VPISWIETFVSQVTIHGPVEGILAHVPVPGKLDEMAVWKGLVRLVEAGLEPGSVNS